ncbi:MAG TPA: type I DNA topoisomerase [Cytophagales bacterium]|nr:type I DNA topoisomerase [Cytophagales bacterium]
MSKNLVIVESPAKAKTIEGYLGKDFTVKSSYGHVRDLPKEGLNIDLQNNYKPHYEISPDKKEVISELKKLSKESDFVWLASDDDREGEAISWHLFESLNLDQKKTKRIVFREITKNAILKAIENPREIDLDLVNAQQARRILDRLVGYELSPVLWKKIKTGLSAGRVQSVAVRLIVEREREIEHFKSVFTYKVSAIFENKSGKAFKAKLNKEFESIEEATQFVEDCKTAIFTVKSLEKKDGKKTPAPPFTTSTLQQEAGRKLGFSVAQTMTLAQRLYESGKITYMRTDSVNLSDQALQSSQTEIEKAYGTKYSQTRKFKNKNESAQEAHEAIRPTDFAQHSTDGERNEIRLYELIWKRAIASQMSDALTERTVVKTEISNRAEEFVTTGEVIKFDGFLKVYIESDDSDEGDEENEEAMLPEINLKDILKYREIRANQVYSKPAARYTEPGLVKKLEELGIGRPSTYAPTISTIQKRDYVIKENREGKQREVVEIALKNGNIQQQVKKETYGAEKAKLFPTDLAMIVNDFLVKHFPNVIDFNFTAKVEQEFDDIAEGKMPWEKMIDNFYGNFHQKVEVTQTIDRSTVGTSRVLGKHPETGEEVSVRLGRFGPFVQIGEADENKKPKYASLKKGQLIESISMEEALELFKLPRTVGTYEDKEMVVAVGRFGPYVKHGSNYYSLKKEDDPHTVDESRAIEIIQEKLKADSEKLIKEFSEAPDVKVLNGRYGPYIVAGKKNVKIPKGKEPQSLTLEECLALAEATPEKKKGGFKTKKK